MNNQADLKGEVFRNLTRFLTLLVIITGLALAGCNTSAERLTPTSTYTGTPTTTATQSPVPGAAGGVQVEPTAEQVLATPTPAPTATPSGLDMAVDDIVARTGIKNLEILGLSGENLVNFLISVLIVLVASLLGSILIDGLIWLSQFTPMKYDDQILKLLERQLKWIFSLVALQYATARLAFLTSGLKQWVGLFYFALFVIVFSSIVFQLIDFLLKGPLQKAATPENRGLLVAFTPLLRRSLELVVIVVGLAIVLRNVGVNLSALLAILGLGGLAVSLAGKETLEDMINGFIILIDRPFHVGDRIKIDTMDQWGDVEAIGPRTTRIRTIDNRLVIVPNAVIGRNQVENYTFPDPSILMNVEVGIGYGADIDEVSEIIKRAIQEIPGLMQTKPPVVLFNEFGDSAMIFRILYWLDSYRDVRIKSEVHKAIYTALSDADVEMPFPTMDVNVSYPDQPEMSN